MIKQVDNSAYIIDTKNFKRFNQRQNVFGRMRYDKKSSFYNKGMYENIKKIISNNQKGYSHVEFAKVMGAWTVYDYFHNAFSWEKLKDANSVMKKPELDRHIVTDTDVMSKKVKDIAKTFGASLVGITKIDQRWIYSKDINGKTIEIPKENIYAIVMAIKMDGDAIKTSPTFNACSATAIAYSKMAFCISCLAEFIRNLGYNAIPMGNDTALSIPLAIDAGLGELGRNGLLITPEYGPCVRICKVFTDLPLETDKPKMFGVKEFCKNCNKCAQACEADAIQKDKEPSFKTVCPSNNPGIYRWAVDHDKCYEFWIENGGDCSNCIAACPFFLKKE